MLRLTRRSYTQILGGIQPATSNIRSGVKQCETWIPQIWRFILRCCHSYLIPPFGVCWCLLKDIYPDACVFLINTQDHIKHFEVPVSLCGNEEHKTLDEDVSPGTNVVAGQELMENTGWTIKPRQIWYFRATKSTEHCLLSVVSAMSCNVMWCVSTQKLSGKALENTTASKRIYVCCLISVVLRKKSETQWSTVEFTKMVNNFARPLGKCLEWQLFVQLRLSFLYYRLMLVSNSCCCFWALFHSTTLSILWRCVGKT